MVYFIFCGEFGNVMKKYNVPVVPRVGENIVCPMGSYAVTKIHHILSDNCMTYVYADKVGGGK